jgi:hypothetical protein
MKLFRGMFATLALAGAGALADSAASAATLDRYYRLGDDPAEATTNGGPVGNGLPVNATRDSQGVAGQAQLIHLQAVNTPTYRTITGRPDGGGGLGIEFNGAQQEYLRGPNLNDPAASISAVHPDATLNYTNVFDRGMQFWARPASTAVQTLVMDSNQHGVRIDSSGRFSMRYAGIDYPSTVSVVPNTWYHIEVVRPATFVNGSRMYINGIAVAAAPGGYNTDLADLVIGSNTAGDDLAFTGGTMEFYSGIIDELKMFVIGQAPASGSKPAADYGAFNFATDNDFAAFTLSGVPGDLNNDGALTPADKDAFIAGWLTRKVVNGIPVGDLVTFGQGDLNFDGITNIHDLVLMQSSLSGAGIGAITAADLQGLSIPEPSTAILLLACAAGLSWTRHGRRS